MNENLIEDAKRGGYVSEIMRRLGVLDKFRRDTLSDKTVRDLVIGGDQYGLWNRLINYGFTPQEHWRQGADQLTWTGFATYTNFVTPSYNVKNLSALHLANNAGVRRSFYYRPINITPAVGHGMYCRVGISFLVSAGLMIDDGVDTGDGNGANNFYRVYITQSAVAGAVTAVEEYRTGGGAVTTNVGPTMPYGFFTGLAIRGIPFATFAAWSAAPYTFNEQQAQVQYTSGKALAFTPTRQGLFAVYSAADHGRQAIWDWYYEGNWYG